MRSHGWTTDVEAGFDDFDNLDAEVDISIHLSSLGGDSINLRVGVVGLGNWHLLMTLAEARSLGERLVEVARQVGAARGNS